MVVGARRCSRVRVGGQPAINQLRRLQAEPVFIDDQTGRRGIACNQARQTETWESDAHGANLDQLLAGTVKRVQQIL